MPEGIFKTLSFISLGYFIFALWWYALVTKDPHKLSDLDKLIMKPVKLSLILFFVFIILHYWFDGRVTP